MPRLRKWLAHNCGLVRSIQIWSILIAIACMGIFTGYMLSQAGATATVAEVRAEYQAQLGRDRTGYLARINGQRDTIAQLRDLLGKNLDSMQNVLADNTSQLQHLTDKVSTASATARSAATSAQSASARASTASTQATKAVTQAVSATRKVEKAAEVLDKVTDAITPAKPSGDVPDWLNTP